MMIETFSKTLTRSAMADRIGVGRTAISNAVTRGKFPPSWFSILKQMADEAGIECPMCLFAFVEPVAPNQDGDAEPAAQGQDANTSSVFLPAAH